MVGGRGVLLRSRWEGCEENSSGMSFDVFTASEQ